METAREGLARRTASAILASRRHAANSNPMRRIPSHIRLLAVLVALCFAVLPLAASTAWGAAGSVNLSGAQKAELDKQVQEQLAKDEASGSTGSSGLTGGASSAAGAALGGAGSTGGGLGGSSEAFSNLTQQAQPEEEESATKTTSNASSTSSSGISTGVLVPIFIAGLLLLGGIAFLILRDARSVAPAGEMLSGNSVQDRAARQRKRRAKAKAARQQRKRNR
jgi:hypothetical protein